MHRVSRLSRFIRVPRDRSAGEPLPTPVLSPATVLEEEYAALHPEEPAADLPTRVGFEAGDIADLEGLARALVASTPANPLHALGALVVAGSPALADVLRATLAHGRTTAAPDEAGTRRLLAERLTRLLEDDLEALPATAGVLRRVRARDDGTFAALPRPARNRVLLETAFAPFLRTAEDHRLAAVHARIRASSHAALCLSGGGIRSAAFAMGVVRGLARHGLLARFHYLSTVSGGGYTGSWLSAWMARDGAARVHEELAGAPAATRASEPAPLRHVRRFSFYLAPRFGLLSADSWTLVATIMRNILLVWLVTLPVLAAALMLPRLFVAGPMTTLHEWNGYGIDPADLMAALLGIGTVCAIAAIAFVLRHLHAYGARHGHAPSARAPVTVHRFVSRCFVPLLVAVIALVQAWEMGWALVRFSPDEAVAGSPVSQRAWSATLVALDPAHVDAVALALAAGLAFWTFTYVVAFLFSARGREGLLFPLALSVLCGAIAGAIGALGSATLFGLTRWHHPPEFYATFAVPLALASVLVSTHVVVGLASRRMTDAEREANARFSAWLLIGIVGWIAIVGLALYGPYLLVDAAVRVQHLLGIAGASGLATAAIAASSRSTTVRDPSRPGTMLTRLRSAGLALAAPIFAATVVVLVSILDGALLRALCPAGASWCAIAGQGGGAGLAADRLSLMERTDFIAPQAILLACLGLAAVGYLTSRLIDTNRFSLHAMYRVRLVRTFLGASRAPGERQPNPFTGFDDRDDLPVGALWPGRSAGAGDAGATAAAHPPLHLLNLTLNMVADTDLATQDRKATSLTVSALHAGSAAVGYRRTSARVEGARRPALYGGAGGISLGTAMAISGAAASPNAGYHSSPAVTFLMTLFNARLGWWLGNPGPAGRTTFADDEPRLALAPILDEMFGRTTDRSHYVYLSDGGHFENLGLYEMVRRRCRFILVSDAGCDPTGAFDDLGGAIRKVRIDFGIPIDFPAGIPIRPRGASAPAASASDGRVPDADARYWAVGRVRYSQVDGGGADADGVLLYVKPAFYGREPYDVVNYATSTPSFPHESTGNQFFGEAQFESYRALGEFAVDELCRGEFGQQRAAGVVSRTAFDQWLRAQSGVAGATSGELEAPLLPVR